MLSLVSCVSRVVVLWAAVLVTTSITMPGEWGEEGVTYSQLGKDVTLTCAGVSPGHSSLVPGSPMEWRWSKATRLPAGATVQPGQQLLLPRAEFSSEGTYTCYDASGLLLGSITLRLGRLPGLPSVSCRASNYENFSCFWTSSIETFLPTRYITTYRKKQLPGSVKQRKLVLQHGKVLSLGSGVDVEDFRFLSAESIDTSRLHCVRNSHAIRSPATNVGLCIQDPTHPFSCTVNESHFWSSYRMNVTEVNPLGSSFRLLDITVHAIIKPDPPEGLRVEPVPSAPQRLRVSWEYPSTWPKEPHFQLKFRLQYRPVIYTSWSVVETANISEVITDAFMGLEHVVQVSAKDFLDAGSWSEWSSEAWGMPSTGQTAVSSEATPAVSEPEGPEEEPSLAPNNEPVAGRPDPAEKVAVLVSLGVFAFFVLAAILAFGFLVWIRVKKNSKEAANNHDLIAAAIHLKALPKPQIL